MNNKAHLNHHLLRVQELKSTHEDSVVIKQKYLQSRFKVCKTTSTLI